MAHDRRRWLAAVERVGVYGPPSPWRRLRLWLAEWRRRNG